MTHSATAQAAEKRIELRVDRISQLFNMLDPFPFRERDIDAEAEAFIVGWARELPRDARIGIVVHLPLDEAAAPEARALAESMAHYFAAQENALAGELRELFRIGRLSLAIGCVVLAVCLAAARLIAGMTGLERFYGFASEGLLILGWVALWRPMEIFLYDWWPIAQRRRLYRRLAQARIEVVPVP